MSKLLNADETPVTQQQLLRARLMALSEHELQALHGQMQSWSRAPLGRRHQPALGTLQNDLDDYNPLLLPPDNWQQHDYETEIGRVRHMLQYDSALGGGATAKADLEVGPGAALVSIPDARALGIDLEHADDLGKAFQSWFNGWANDPLRLCDWHEQKSFGQMQNIMSREFAATGEAYAVLGWREEGRYATRLQLINTDRVSTPDGVIDDEKMYRGLELDDSGRVVAVHIRDAHKYDMRAIGRRHSWSRYEMREEWGRPRVVRIANLKVPDQQRGLTDLVACLAQALGAHKYTDAELKNATLNALMFASVYSDLPADALADMLSTGAEINYNDYMKNSADWYGEQGGLKMNSHRFQRMFGSDRLELHTSARDTSDVESMFRIFCRQMAMQLGMTYENFTGDFSQINYSGMRAAFAKEWRRVTAQRAVLNQANTLVLMAVLEEGFDRGEFRKLTKGLPDFWSAYAAYARAKWIGPPRGFIDPVKEQTASVMRVESGMSSLTSEMNEQGNDRDTIIQELLSDRRAIEEAGLSMPSLAPLLAASATVNAADGQQARNG